MQTRTGFVVTWNAVRAYGFIGCESGPDVFFHCSSVLDFDAARIKPGLRVKFDVVSGADGRPKAAGVSVVE
jgi:cold shock CspA family protein